MLVHQELTDRILRACYIVHRALGCGFLEKVYQEAVAITLQEMCIPFEREKHLPIIYHGIQLKCDYIADFIVAGEVVLELKATPELTSVHEAQTINYLKATGIKVGLLVNFGQPKLQIKRLVY